MTLGGSVAQEAEPRLLIRHEHKAILWAGFGGLFLLMAIGGVSAVTSLSEIQGRHESIRSGFLARVRLLESLRNEVYRSGTKVHDFLLEENPQGAEVHRQAVLASKRQIEMLEAIYAKGARPDERQLFASLEHEIDVYFQAMLPVLDWTPEQRERQVNDFIRDQMHPRRAVMLTIADQIEALNARDMERNTAETDALFVRYRERLVTIVTVTLITGACLVAVSLWWMGRLEDEADARFQQVATARAELKTLSAALVTAQEVERRKLSRELHDEIGQGLWAMVLNLGNADAALEHHRVPDAQRQLGNVRRLLDSTVRTVRDLSLLLRPSILDDLGLVPAVNWLGREISRTTDLRVMVSAEAVSDDLPETYRTCIYRVVQETLRNVQRHASAHTARVELLQRDGLLKLAVTDDGVGFQPLASRGLGVLGMEERVTQLGGHFQLTSTSGQGTVIRVELPLHATIGADADRIVSTPSPEPIAAPV